MQNQAGDELEGSVRSLVWRLRALVQRRRSATLITTALIGVALVAVYTATAVPVNYVLVIDCGSTGTRIHAYTWKQRHRQLPHLEAVPVSTAQHKVPNRRAGERRAYERVETEPGLDQFVSDPKGLVEVAIAPLLDWAEEVVPRRSWAATPVLLFGTAGLRRLTQQQQQSVLGTAGHVLAASPFRFKPSWARTISGEQEGIYGWIAVNYLTNRLALQPHPRGEVAQARAGQRTVGAVDLGGSSMEVTFVPAEPSPTAVTANVSVLGVQYGLFTHTHEGFGLNNAFDRSVSLLLRNSRDSARELDMTARVVGGEKTVDPGLGSGAAAVARDVDAGKLANSLKSGIRRTLATEPHGLRHPCLQTGYSQPYSRLAQAGAVEPATVLLVGEPDWQACEQLANAVVNASGGCPQPPCTLGTRQPRTHQPLYALTGFHVVYHFFGLDPGATLEQLEAKGRRYCDTDWTAIAARRGSEVHVDRYCFRVPYVMQLLRAGLGVPQSQLRIGSGREAWTLGAALAEGASIGLRTSRRQPLFSQGVLAAVAAAWLLWLLFLGWTWRGSGGGIAMDRKGSGHRAGDEALTRLYHTGGVHSTPLQTHPIPGGQSAGGGGAVPQSPTAVVGGNFSSNIARLSTHTNQRKRVPSVDNLGALH